MITQAELDFRAARGGLTQNAKLAMLFLDRPREWVPMTELARVLGCFAVHSRVADVRRRFAEKGGDIFNRTRLVDGQRHSFYWFCPDGRRPPNSEVRHGSEPLPAPTGSGAFSSAKNK